MADATVVRRPFLEVWGPTLLMLAFMVGTVYYVRYYVVPSVPTPAPVIDVAEEGERYGVDQLENYAKAMRSIQARIHDGEPIAKAAESGNKELTELNRADFTKRFQPVLSTILPEGSDPTPDQRSKVERFYGQLADGVERLAKKGVK